MAAFAPARSLYLNAGFEPTEPFGDYRPSRNSVYLTLRWTGQARVVTTELRLPRLR